MSPSQTLIEDPYPPDDVCIISCTACGVVLLNVLPVLRTETLVAAAIEAHRCPIVTPNRSEVLRVTMREWLASHDAGNALEAGLILNEIRTLLEAKP